MTDATTTLVYHFEYQTSERGRPVRRMLPYTFATRGPACAYAVTSKLPHGERIEVIEAVVFDSIEEIGTHQGSPRRVLSEDEVLAAASEYRTAKAA